MTEKEAIARLDKDDLTDLDVVCIICDIYNYFENKTCDSCKYFKKGDSSAEFPYDDNSCEYIGLCVDDKFGCNRWESK